MQPFYSRGGITLYVGDCREVAATLDPESISAVVTDPPYGLSFMGRDWDHSVPGVAFWEAFARLLTPGAHLAAFGGTRTFHRIAVAIEDAGFEVRDTLMWLYGSGMPKGWNFDNRVPVENWCRCTGGNAVSYDHEGDDHGQPQTEHNLRSVRNPDLPPSVHVGEECREVLLTGVSEPGASAHGAAHGAGVDEGREQPVMGRRALHRAGEGLRNGASPGSPEGAAERLCVGAHPHSRGDARATAGTGRGSASHQPQPGGQPTGELAGVRQSSRPLDDGALRNGGACPRCGKLRQDFHGFDVALKPAYEPCIVARKPLSSSVYATVLAHGTGALNIDASRVAATTDDQRAMLRANTPGAGRYAATDSTIYGNGEGLPSAQRDYDPSKGRWPANILLDPEAAAVLDAMIGEREKSHISMRGELHGNVYGNGKGLSGPNGRRGYTDIGGASRFFPVLPLDDPETLRFLYCPKASRAERNAGLEGMPERKHVEGEYLDFAHPAPEGIGAWLREQRERAGLTAKDVARHFPSKTGGLTGCVANWEHEYNRPTPEQWRKLCEVIGFDDRYDDVMTELAPVERAQCDNPYLRAKTARTNSHPTVKPLALMRWLLTLVTPTGGVILDPFAGSGSTLVAAAQLGIAAVGIELSEEYAAIAARRIDHALDAYEAGVRHGNGTDASRAGGGKPSGDKPEYVPNGKNKVFGKGMGGGAWDGAPNGRWPANVLMDRAAAAVLDAQSGERGKSSGGRIHSGATGKSGIYGTDERVVVGDPGYGDTGGASRFMVVLDDGDAPDDVPAPVIRQRSFFDGEGAA